MPIASIIIPAYNSAEFIRAAIESCISQDFDSEVIVVDDGSTDRTAEVVTSIGSPIVRLIRKTNGGVSSARNVGLDVARGRSVLLLDADDRLRPHALRRLWDALSQDDRYLASYGSYVRIDRSGDTFPQRGLRSRLFLERRIKPTGDVLRFILRRNFLVNGGVALFHRNEMTKPLRFDENLHLSEDWAFFCALAARGPFTFIGGEPVLEYRVHGASAMAHIGRSFAAYNAASESVQAQLCGMPSITEKDLCEMRTARNAHAAFLISLQKYTERRYGESLRWLLASCRSSPRSATGNIGRYAFFIAADRKGDGGSIS